MEIDLTKAMGLRRHPIRPGGLPRTPGVEIDLTKAMGLRLHTSDLNDQRHKPPIVEIDLTKAMGLRPSAKTPLTAKRKSGVEIDLTKAMGLRPFSFPELVFEVNRLWK